MRKTIGSALALSLGLALFLVLRAERGERRGPSGAPASGAELPGRRAELDGERLQSSETTPLDERDAVDPTVNGETAASAIRGMRLVVRDAVDERPIAGALATLFDRATPVAQRTERDGACVVPVDSFVEPALLCVEAAGHFHWSQEIVPTPNLTVALPRSTILSGRVLAADTGRPIQGAELALQHDSCSGCEPERSLSAPDGGYELPSVPLRSEALLEVRAEGFATARRTFELRSDEPRVTQDIHLVRGLELSGRVEDWTSGRGIAGAHVGELVADAQGRFRGRILAGPATGRTSFAAHAPGYATLRTAFDVPHEEELVLRLPLLAVLEGRVTDSTGQPLADARLSFDAAGPDRDSPSEETSPLYELPDAWSYWTDPTPAESGPDGQYVLAVLPWSLNCTIRVQKRGFLNDEARFRTIGEPGSRKRLDWWLKAGEEPTIVSGTVTLNGQACGALEGTVSWRGPTRSADMRFSRGGYLVEVEPGELRVSAVLDLLPRLRSREVVAQLGPGAARVIDLDVVAPTAPITGSVRFEDDTPVAGRWVHARCPLPTDEPDSFGLVHQTVTDEEGKFLLRVTDLGLPFEVFTPDFAGNALTMEEVAPGASGVDFVLGKGYRVFLRAREASTGAALAMDEEVQFLARAPGSGFSRLEAVSATPDVDGWYECGMTEREADLLALPRASELPLYSTHLLPRVKLDGPTPARIEFLLERGLDVALELAQGVAPWPADHELLLLDEELWRTASGPRGRRWSTPFDELEAQCSVHFDARGHAFVRGLAPGNYRFKPLPGDLLVDPELVRVDRNTLPVIVRWSRRE